MSLAIAGNIGKVLVMIAWPLLLIATSAGLDDPVALLPLQLLWLNLITDGLLGLSLGAEPAEPDTMRRPPVQPTAGIFSGGLGDTPYSSVSSSALSRLPSALGTTRTVQTTCGRR